jgi:hypothetical protein
VHAGFHSQLSPQVWVPVLFCPQRRVEPGIQLPWFEQFDQFDHSAVSLSHVRDCTPQLPQACVVEPLQTCPLQLVFQRHVFVQVCVPPAPQLRVPFGAHAP